MGYEEDQSRISMVLVLQEARIGDPGKLASIKKSLDSRKELADGDKQYLEEKSVELQKMLEHQTMVDWAGNFVENLKAKQNKKVYTIEELEHLIETEKNKNKIDQKFMERVSTKLKEAIEQEKKVEWTLDLISQLKQAGIGHGSKLDQISRLLETGKPVGDSDKQYLMELQTHFQKVSECKDKVTWSLDAIRKLQEAEIGHLGRLASIRHEIEQGNLISEKDQTYLNFKYEKLRRALDSHNRIEWTKRTVASLGEFGLGDKEKLVAIKQLLDAEIPLPKNDIEYLRQQHRLLRQVLSHTRRLELVVELIEKLQETKIGDSQRLDKIRKTIEERQNVSEVDIAYLKDRYRVFDITTKSSQTVHSTDTNQDEEIDYNSIITELNETIMESARPQIKVSKQYF